MEETPERRVSLSTLGTILDNEGLGVPLSQGPSDLGEEDEEKNHTPNILISPSVESASESVFFSSQEFGTSSHTSRNGHTRSASHGGSSSILALRPSALKKPGHRRVFSHGQITVGFNGAKEPAHATTSESCKGHKRTNSKTEFILPPGHEDRERKKRNSLSRSSSARHHKRQDSLGFFKGHSRQASRTDSVYTIRTPATNPEKLFSFNLFGKSNRNEEHPGEVKQRVVVPDHVIPNDIPEAEHPNHKYTKNQIRTTKYTLLWFLPKNLFEQFHRCANLYFLFIVLLNWVPAINAFGKEVSMIPVIFVLGFTAIKDLFEDRRRYQSGKRINNSTCRVYKSLKMKLQ
uniref:Probable phospholipid-transporting ATPase VD n=1 Tax=Caligus clemensi TaxID=344056 RepID=C1C1W9_CALCM|nr:Probable phospholipid-transporting ATPase VD [Caligus clemensi]